MTKFIQAHEKWIRTVIAAHSPINQTTIKIHLRKIKFLQHERLVHLLITLFFSWIEIVLVLFIVSTSPINWFLVVLTGIVSIRVF